MFLVWFCMTTRHQMLADLVEIVHYLALRRVTPWFMRLSKTYKVSLWAALEFGRLVLSRS